MPPTPPNEPQGNLKRMKNRMNVPEVYEPVLPGKVSEYIAKKKATAKANDLRAQLPECPLEYEVPYIPSNHTALVIPVTAADIHWQEKMLPWTLASLINNTDIIVKGVHLYIACDAGVSEDRIRTALSLFDLPENTILEEASITVSGSYAHLCFFDINYWAFRDEQNTHKLPSEHIIVSDSRVVELYPDISQVPPAPGLYDMTHCTIEQFRHAIKHLMGAQLSMKV